MSKIWTHACLFILCGKNLNGWHQGQTFQPGLLMIAMVFVSVDIYLNLLVAVAFDLS